MDRIMVNMAKINTTEVAEQTGVPTEHVERVVNQLIINHNNNKRQPKPSPPDGGISIRAAARKYGIAHRTISRWVKAGYIPVLQHARNWLYIDEAHLANLVNIYKTNPGQGKKTIKSSGLSP